MTALTSAVESTNGHHTNGIKSHANGHTAAAEAIAKQEFSHLTLYTGNTMRTGTTGMTNAQPHKSNQELISALEDTLLHSMNTAHVKGNAITIRDETSLGSLEEERSKYEITAKLFYLPTSGDRPLSVQAIDTAIQNVETVLGASKIDHFILSLPKQVFDENGTDEEELQEFEEELNRSVLPVWSHLSALRQSGQIGRLGVAEFSKQQLELLKAKATATGGVAPEINQVNLADCCVLPRDLVEYAKKEGIELLTHGDAHDLLPQNTFAKLLEPYLTASSAKIHPNFVVKYSAFIHSRGLVTKKGYIIDASA
ncbi:hypothetical protein BGZ73_003973 [Actinomortierella ambigua]|nr:hypothetical protein BGZ73_003973 [Actinomortierella ambigua]